MLYFELMEYFDNEYTLSRAMAPIIGKNAHAINMYFRDVFTAKFTVGNTRAKYINGMKQLLEKEKIQKREVL